MRTFKGLQTMFKKMKLNVLALVVLAATYLPNIHAGMPTKGLTEGFMAAFGLSVLGGVTIGLGISNAVAPSNQVQPASVKAVAGRASKISLGNDFALAAGISGLALLAVSIKMDYDARKKRKNKSRELHQKMDHFQFNLDANNKKLKSLEDKIDAQGKTVLKGLGEIKSVIEQELAV